MYIWVAMKHHYVPVFYLKRWVGLDGKICEFSRPYRDIVPKRVHPAGTGYINDLYRLPGVEGEGAQKLEQLFFSPVDSWASDALAKMHDGRTSNWNVAERSAWTRFVTSLLFRNPDDVSLLIKRMRVDYYITDEKAEARYRVTKRGNYPGLHLTI
jgi:hypothetical protein